MTDRQYHRFHVGKSRAPPPPPSLHVSSIPISNKTSDSDGTSSFPDTFISSLRQLFSILDKTNCGYVPFDVFKRYFDCSSSNKTFLNELELESKSNNHLISFDLLLKVIERSLSPSSTTKVSSANFNSINKRPTLTRSKSVFTINPSVPTNKVERQHSMLSANPHRLETNNINISNPIYYTKKSAERNRIDFSMLRSVKRYEIERNLLIQTCEALDRAKIYLTDHLLEMDNKQKSYCRYLTTTEKTGIAAESMYNRDLVADLYKLASIIVEEANYDLKLSSDYSSTSSSSSLFSEINQQYRRKLRAKDDYIQQLEREKRHLIKELHGQQQQHQHETVIPIEISQK